MLDYLNNTNKTNKTTRYIVISHTFHHQDKCDKCKVVK